MDQPESPASYSWETYLSLESRSELRYEYHDGEIVAMSGGTKRHNQLLGRIYAQLLPIADRQGCEAFTESVKLFRYRSDRYVYPDVMLSCHPLDQQSPAGVRSPLLVVEVLSRATEKRDRGFKMREYFRLPSLQHYLLIEQERIEAWHYQRQGKNRWELRLLTQAEEVIELPELKLRLPLSTIYHKVTLGPEPAQAEEPQAAYELRALTEQSAH
jgi:Uma2 family endonuclease